MVAKAQRSRAPIQTVADQVAGWFVPIVMTIAAAAFIVWWLFGPPPAFSYALIAAVSTLIIACPCALGLATPMSIMVGIGQGAKSGILIRDAEALEVLERVDTVVVDKTGTLTAGTPTVSSITVDTLTEEQLLHLAASLEQRSEHPLAQAVVQAAKDRGVSIVSPAQFHSLPGKGVTGEVAGQEIAVGSRRLMNELAIEVPPSERGSASIYVAQKGALLGTLRVSDPIKENTSEAIQSLHNSGLRVVMLTGDHSDAVQEVADHLDIDEVHSGVLPHEKGAIIEQLREQGSVVAMAGDGVNDAPALALAHVGIAMGTGADVAMESAGITLLRGDLNGIEKSITLSRATMRNIRQNLFFAFAYNALGVPIAAGVLYPFFGVLLSPMIAAAAMSLSSLSVVGNALRLNILFTK
jgi:Cu+-exporting ATPase